MLVILAQSEPQQMNGVFLYLLITLYFAVKEVTLLLPLAVLPM